MSEDQKLSTNKLELERKNATRLMKTPEGRIAFRDALFGTPEGIALVQQEFGVKVIHRNQDKKPIVAVLVPSHKKPDNETGEALARMVPASAESCHVVMRPSVCSSVVHWVRNQMVAQLYKDKIPFDYVLFMDDDMVPPPQALNVLLGRKVDLIGAVCTVRQDPPLPNARHFHKETFYFQTADIDQPGIWKVGAIGTGFMLIKREVLEAVGEYTISQQYQRKHLGMSKEIADQREERERARSEKDCNKFWFEFLKHPGDNGEFGEDISFCLKAMECGFEVYADSSFPVGHVGNYAYSLEDYWFFRDEAVKRGLVVPLKAAPEPQAAPQSDTKISILVPTRGRKENVMGLCESIRATSSRMPEIVFYVDDDDEQMKSFHFEDYGGTAVLGPRRCLSECWNECAKRAAGDILMHGGDDIIFKTPGWDNMVRQAFDESEDKIIFVHGDDGHWGDKFGTHGFIHRKWMEAVGYFVPPYFSSDFNDTWLNEVANALGRRVYLPFVTEHMHPLFGKAEWDKTHNERLERHKKDNVEQLYKDLAPKRTEDARKLRWAMIPRNGEVFKLELAGVGQ